MSEEEQKLIDLYHRALDTKDNDVIIASSLELAQHYYEQKEMQKAKHCLNRINKINSKVENVHLYLGLIDLYYNHIENAKEELKKEIKYFPKNVFAKKILHKVSITTNFPYATLFISSIMVILFLMLFYPEMSVSQTLLYGVSKANLSWFSAITSVFSHINLIHLILNILILVSLGAIVERHIGTLYFTLFFIFTGIISNIGQVIVTSNNIIIIGASGAIFGIMGILLMQQPLLKLRLFGIIKIPIIIIYGSLFSLSLLFSQYTFGSAEISHMFGLFIGIFYAGLFYHETIEVFYNWVIITFGFYFLIKLPEQILLNQLNSYTLITSILLFVIGLLLVVYSYTKLISLSKFREEN